MKTGLSLVAGLVMASTVATVAIGDGHANKAAVAAAKARQAQMQLYAFNLGVLGAMAKGTIEYNADQAKGAAGNLASLTSMNQAAYWIPGSDNGSIGDATKALPAIWTADSKARDISIELAKASAAMDAVAGDGLDAVRGAIGGIGKTCGACHDGYRQPK